MLVYLYVYVFTFCVFIFFLSFYFFTCVYVFVCLEHDLYNNNNNKISTYNLSDGAKICGKCDSIFWLLKAVTTNEPLQTAMYH